MNNLAFILECLFCFCIAKTSLRQVSADPRVASPKRISAVSLPIVGVGTVYNFGVTTCNIIKRCIYPRKNVEKAQDSGPRWGAHSAPPDFLAGFQAVSP